MAESISKVREKIIELQHKKMYKATTAAEKKILDAIFDSFIKELGQSKGNITASDGSMVKLSNAVDRIFEAFQKSEGREIANSMIQGYSSISDLNKKYFESLKVRTKELKNIASNTDKKMMQRIGVNEKGELSRGGFLSLLISDSTLRNDIKRELLKAKSGGYTIENILTNIRSTVVGDKDREGGLTHHYRTFAHDTFAQYDSLYGDEVAKGLDLNCAVYEGGLIEESREFCKKHNGKVLTRKEIEKLKDDKTLLVTKDEKRTGTKDYDPIRDRGRWNCRHNWNWITDRQAIALRPELKKVLGA